MYEKVIRVLRRMIDERMDEGLSCPDCRVSHGYDHKEDCFLTCLKDVLSCVSNQGETPTEAKSSESDERLGAFVLDLFNTLVGRGLLLDALSGGALFSVRVRIGAAVRKKMEGNDA